MNGKLIITKADWCQNENSKIFTGLYSDKKFYQVGFSNEPSDSVSDVQVGEIFVGRVRDIVKNINAAFIEIQSGYTGYYSLDENTTHMFLNPKNTEKVCQGDLLLVQVKKAAVKTKAPVLTSKISLTGKYMVLNINGSGIGFSNKIYDKEIRAHIKTFIIESVADVQDYGIIVRTNAESAKDSELLSELQDLINEWKKMLTEAWHRPCYSIIKQAEPEYLRLIKGFYTNEIDEIVTDSREIYSEVEAYLNRLDLQNVQLTLYEDVLLPLYKLYSIESLTKNILSKNVWLKSGAYLVIEPTEAMVVIDVNTGKCVKGKNQEDTIFKVNVEAAKEIASQIRLRNLSGIIVIDFINMDTEESRLKLIEELKYYISMDKIKTTFVEMTKLNLVLLTRKKIDAPVYEQI